MNDDDCLGEGCAYHGPITASMETLYAVAAVTALMGGPPKMNEAARTMRWKGVGADGHVVTVDGAFGHGRRPVLRVTGEGIGRAEIARLCSEQGFPCVGADGEHIAGDEPAFNPWAGKRRAKAAPRTIPINLGAKPTVH